MSQLKLKKLGRWWYLTQLLPILLFYKAFLDASFLISVVTRHDFNPTAKLTIPTGLTTKKAKEEIETHLVTIENKTKHVQYNLNSYKSYFLIISF